MGIVKDYQQKIKALENANRALLCKQHELLGKIAANENAVREIGSGLDIILIRLAIAYGEATAEGWQLSMSRPQIGDMERYAVDSVRDGDRYIVNVKERSAGKE